ncbi:MAG TPA: hypothetical protein VJ949_09445 [Cryomorphaceae bacterium]|nr:hypothetical protein [Cryomorphaceae bacterium]
METQIKTTAPRGLQVLMIMAEVYSRKQTKKAKKKVSDALSQVSAG